MAYLTGALVHDARICKGISQRDLGVMIGYKKSSAQAKIADIEAGRQIARAKLIPMAKALDLPVEKLI